jgi:hypothetical protein
MDTPWRLQYVLMNGKIKLDNSTKNMKWDRFNVYWATGKTIRDYFSQVSLE